MTQSRLSSRECSHALFLDPDSFEPDILRAYVQLAVMPDQANGVKTATVARFGSVEVRLTELTQPEHKSRCIAPFWLEVYSHASGTTLDSCGCFTFDEPELATAADLICDAKRIAAATLLGPQGNAGMRP
ncbi:hypothetical protein AA309_25150 [Microvirga vignae]|uniref:Uncharacterized protein n=1 Tax=Microvirga vignae TaxID=1225564 RepID=A0A0H1R5N2_9HYPH|nr:hypothetical protein [Microvirga vignae]KLK90545.1 hypothetical protein AA309_25150 [Microvirga vignae]